MMSTTISSSSASMAHTRAWLTFEQNLESVAHMVAMGGHEINLLKKNATSLSTYLSKHRDLTTNKKASKLLQLVNDRLNVQKNHIDRYLTANLWQVVILVTCVEAYLQDLLSDAASVDPELMSKSQQLAPYSDVMAATSLDELAHELRVRWARGWLSDGGPTRWIPRLIKMGARGYPKDIPSRLELIWGIRHVVVHRAGITTADFVKRHPGVGTKVGDRLKANMFDFKVFLEAVKSFMEPTEHFFLKRYPSLAVAASKGPSKT